MKEMKKLLFAFLLTLLFASAIAIPSSAISASHWAIDYADFAINERLLLETDSRSDVNADAAFLRQEVPFALGRIQDADELYFTHVETGFTDVSVGHPYAGAILWGKENGIISGVGNNQFAPANPVTREQMCAFIYRYCNNFSITLPVVNSMPSFTDASSITSALLPAVTAVCRADIFHGYSDGSFRPKQTITKAEACNVLTLLHGIKNNSASQLNMYIKDKDGNAVTSAACYFYTASYGNMSWTPVYSVLGFARSNTVTGAFGINVLGVNTMAAVPALTYPSRRYVFVTLPGDQHDNLPVPGFSPKAKWPHSNCGDSWAFNHNAVDTYCGVNYVKSCQNFGWRFINSTREFHQGIDIGGGGVSAKNVAGKTMYVNLSRFDATSMGNYVQLRDLNRTLYLTYMHMASRTVLTEGASVSNEAEVGITGNTGGDSMGAHLHLQASTASGLGAGSTTESRSYFIDPRVYIK